MPGYVLSVAAGGIKFHETTTLPRQAPSADDQSKKPPPAEFLLAPDGYPDLSPAGGRKLGCAIFGGGRGRCRFSRASMKTLLDFLIGETGKPVVDRTGLTGLYDFEIYWVSQRPGMPATTTPSDTGVPVPQDPGIDLFTALRRELGLKLEAQVVPVPVLVVEHADRMPAGN